MMKRRKTKRQSFRSIVYNMNFLVCTIQQCETQKTCITYTETVPKTPLSDIAQRCCPAAVSDFFSEIFTEIK